MGGGASNVTETKTLLPPWSAKAVQLYMRTAFQFSLNAYPVYTGQRYPWEHDDYPQTHGGVDAVGSTYAAQNADEIAGIADLASLARNGITVYGQYLEARDFVDDAKTLLLSVMQGNRLFINSTLSHNRLSALIQVKAEQLAQKYNEDIVPAIDQAANLGRYYGGSQHIAQYYQAIDHLAAEMAVYLREIYQGDYIKGVEEVMDALPLVSPLAQEDLRDLELLRQAGLYWREYRQGALIDTYKAWLDAEEMNVNKVNLMGNAVKALIGAQVSRTAPMYRPSAMATVAGIAATGTAAVMALYSKDNEGWRQGAGSFASTGRLANEQSKAQMQALTRDQRFDLPKLRIQEFGGTA